MARSIEQLNREIFGGELAPEVLELMQGVDQERSEVREFVDRMFRLMQRARLEARDFSRLLAWEVGSILPKILPGAWGGSVPPITLERRHAIIDRYMGCNRWTALGRIQISGFGMRVPAADHSRYRQDLSRCAGSRRRSVFWALHGVRCEWQLCQLQQEYGVAVLPSRPVGRGSMGRIACGSRSHEGSVCCPAEISLGRNGHQRRRVARFGRTRRRSPR